MRQVDRNTVPVPKELANSAFLRMRQSYLTFLKLDPRERAQTRPPDRHLPTAPDLMPALNELFLGKCAFCESRRSDLSVYRFRPTSEALPLERGPDANLYYGWLADAWENLYPICPECIPKQMNDFPVRGQRVPAPTAEEYLRYVEANNGVWPPSPNEERPVLLDPCAASPDIDLRLRKDGSLVGVTKWATQTIEHFNLNRKSLADRRRRACAKWARSQAHSVPPSEEFAGLLTVFLLDAGKRPAPQDRQPPRPVPTRPAADVVQWELKSIEITAFKALEHIRVELPKRELASSAAPTPALLILGENAAGKSSLLEAIALAMIPDAARKRLGESPEKLLLHPRYLGDERKARRSRGEVRLVFVGDNGSAMERKLVLTPQGFHSEGPLPSGLPIFGYGAYRHYRDKYHRWQPERPVVSLFRTDNLLSNPERWLLQLDESRFDTVISALRDIIGVGFRNVEREGQQCLVVITQQDRVTHRTPLDSVSSGFRTILALTCDVMRWLMEREKKFITLSMARGIVLIDEVEAHLHPRWKVTIMDGLRRALPSMTFIATTHDPLCLRGMREGEVLVLQRIPGTAANTDLPSMVETVTTLPDVTKLTVEQLLTSDLFSLFDIDDPVAGQAMAELADALAVSRAGAPVTNVRMQQVLQKFREEVGNALPVGATEVSRLVQDAVADYVIQRGRLPAADRRTLRDSTKERIRLALGST